MLSVYLHESAKKNMFLIAFLFVFVCLFCFCCWFSFLVCWSIELKYLQLQKQSSSQMEVVHDFNPSPWGAEGGEFL